MPQYIFDLDLTLYSKDDFKDTDNEIEYYNSFQPKTELAKQLRSLKGNKYILTNANIAHVDEVLDKLDLKDIFQDMMSSDVADSYKPAQDIYHIANHIFELDKYTTETDNKIYFFEDLAANLKAGKKLYGWETVLISNKKLPKRKYIDYTFPNVEEALSYFNEQEKFDKNNILKSKKYKNI